MFLLAIEPIQIFQFSIEKLYSPYYGHCAVGVTCLESFKTSKQYFATDSISTVTVAVIYKLLNTHMLHTSKTALAD